MPPIHSAPMTIPSSQYLRTPARQNSPALRFLRRSHRQYTALTMAPAVTAGAQVALLAFEALAPSRCAYSAMPAPKVRLKFIIGEVIPERRQMISPERNAPCVTPPSGLASRALSLSFPAQALR